MQTIDTKKLVKDFEAVIQDAANARAELEFIKRVMKQAVLTHGVALRVDPAMAEQARTDTRSLEYVAGYIRLVEPREGYCPAPAIRERDITQKTTHEENCASINTAGSTKPCNCSGGDYVASRRGPRQLGAYDG